jgi:cobalt/nickel transport system permease protein
MMDGAVCPVTAVVAVVGIGGAAWAAAKSETKPTAARFAAVSALVFASQMMNFPVQGGTSGHLIGGVLASALLGTPFGILSTALVLSVQCLLFSDGGLAVLGANILNMSLLGAGVGGLLAGGLQARPSALRIAAASWISVVLAAMACSAELALAGVIPFSQSAPVMFGVHALIGLGEALLAVAAVALLPAGEENARRSAAVPAFAALVIALILSPFASGLPDGLEWAAARLGFLHESAPAFVAPLAGYAVPGISIHALSTGLSGVAGVIAVFALGSAISRIWNRSAAMPVS